MINVLKRKIQLLIGRCVINTIKNNKYQIELLADETRDDIEVMQHFGFKSVPPKKTVGLTLSIGGLRDDTVVVATENDSAPELKEGESCINNNFSEKIELLEKLLKLTGEEININGNSKQLVTHAELDSALSKFLTELKTSLSTTPIAGNGSPQTWAGFPTAIDISASKTKTINVE